MWHTLNSAEVFALTGSSVEGLCSAEAFVRISKYGPNEILEKEKKPVWKIILNQFNNFMILVLIAAAVISGVIGDLTDSLIILVIVILNALVGFVQEYRAEKVIEALKEMTALNAIVKRNGYYVLLPSSNLVPGDIVLLETGNAIPADIRWIETHNIRVDESALTGESAATDKSVESIVDLSAPPGDRTNMGFKGTIVTNGRGVGLVVSTGMDSEIGKIATLLQEESTDTPLQKRMAEFSKKLSFIILLICLILFVVGLLRGEEPIEMLLISVSLAVAAIPEALPALITIALAKGARRLVKLNALIRKLPAVESLGSVTYICSDKTGTLTMNRMKVVDVWDATQSIGLINKLTPFYAALSLNHDVKIEKDRKKTGDPTEIALLEFAIKKTSLDTYLKVVADFPRVEEVPFDSTRKCMSTIHIFNDQFLVLIKGATESVTALLEQNNKIEKITALSDTWATNGLRVMALGYKVIDRLPETISATTIEYDFNFAGLVGMMDPAREEVKQAIQDCKTAGIKSVMITGDHPATAAVIARQLGILQEHEQVITGRELREMTPEKLNNCIEHISVYARVSPEQKLTIVKVLQSKKHFVAMTGDGVNDAPALKAADIGVAMGIMGTDVSKEASRMILLDDNFATIVKAVREGRRIYDNIRKFVKYILTCNMAEILTIFMAPLLGLPIPLLPIHILWINLVTDGLPGIALAEEKAEKDIMKRPPRKTDESLFAGGTSYHILSVGMLMAAVTIGVQVFALEQNYHWQTMVFTVLSLSQLGHVLAIRSEKEFLYQQGIFTNIRLFSSVLFTFLLQMLVIYIPAANEILKTEPLSAEELAICMLASAVVFHAVELEKRLKIMWTKVVR
ncbi:MAG: calcium-translocating P-type ATPase, PMCA-type [Bacteroidetes bacterium]|nr:calcium-translocating P-type ATPase, PMCA-type [Bacteroidota bacterium]